MTIKHIWFDMAGTLYEETTAFHVLHDEFRYSTYAKLKGISDLDRARREYLELYKQYGSNSAVFTSLGKPTDFWMKSFETLDIGSALIPDTVVVDTLRVLKERLPISIFTNYTQGQIIEILAHLDIPSDWFTFLLSGDDVAERKPGLDGFRQMVARSGVPAHETMYVGDRLDVDIKPALTVGMQTCLLRDSSQLADYCIESLDQLIGILKP